MLKTFKNKQLAALYAGKRTKISGKFHARILVRLDFLNVANETKEMNVPGFDFHSLRGFNPTRFSIHVNGPWCITFEFKNGNAYRVDFEQYH